LRIWEHDVKDNFDGTISTIIGTIKAVNEGEREVKIDTLVKEILEKKP
jgi:hypothetical protein